MFFLKYQNGSITCNEKGPSRPQWSYFFIVLTVVNLCFGMTTSLVTLMDKRCLICYGYIRSLDPKRIVVIVNHAAVDVVGDSCYHGQNQQQPHQLPQAASRLFDGLLWWYRTVIGRCLRCLDRRPEVDWRVIFRPGDGLLNLLKNTTSWFLSLTLYPALALPFHFPQCCLFALAWMEKNKQKTSFRVKYSESNELNGGGALWKATMYYLI